MTQCIQSKIQHIIGKKWTLPILQEITTNQQGFNTLYKRLKKVSPKILSQRLKELEEQQIITKETLDGQPLKTTYVITRKGKEFLQIIQHLQEWTHKHNPEEPNCAKINCVDCEHY